MAFMMNRREHNGTEGRQYSRYFLPCIGLHAAHVTVLDMARAKLPITMNGRRQDIGAKGSGAWKTERRKFGL